MNATSLKKHIWELRQHLIDDNSYDIFGVAETRLGSEVNDNIIQVAGYNVVRQDRNVRGGGILLYIKEHLKAKILYKSDTERLGKPLKPEYIFCSVWEGYSAPTLIVLVYRPPDVSIRSDRRLIQLLRSMSPDFSHKAIIGDWNADMLFLSDSDTRFLTNIMDELSVKLINTGPSHHTTRLLRSSVTLTENNATKDTWIDTNFTDSCDSVFSYNRFLPSFPSRHDIITVTLDIFYPSTTNENHPYRCINKISPNDINSLLSTQDWTIFTDNKNFDAEQGLDKLTENLQTAINHLAPEKQLKPKKALYPWVDTDLKLLISKRDATCRRYERTDSRQLLDEYLTLADLTERKSEIARYAYMHNRINNSLDNNKNFWSEMRNLGLIPKPSDALHGFLPDELNNYFSGISFSHSEDTSTSHNLILSAPPEGFMFKEITVNDVILAFSHFQSQATGEDGIPQSIVAKALPSIAIYLTKIFNSSLKNGVFPESWKKSRILALKKVSTPSSASDFRPIVLLCFLSKVLEKLAHAQVVSYLTKSKIA